MWSYNDELYHYGVKGMKWGKRKAKYIEEPNKKNRSYKIYGDGRIEIDKGTDIQRLVGRKNKQDLKGMTYASFTNNDNNKYIQKIGGKGLFGGGRDTKLVLTATTKLKSPSKKDAAKIFFEMLRDDDKLNEIYSKSPMMMGRKFSKKDIDKILKNIESGKDLSEYELANSSLMFDSISNVREEYFSRLKNKGYNMLRDENDVSNGYAKNPIILLDGSASLQLKTKTFITDQMRKDSKEYNKKQKKLVKEWIKQKGLGYDSLLE